MQLDVSIFRRILVQIRSGAILCAKPRFDEDITAKITYKRTQVSIQNQILHLGRNTCHYQSRNKGEASVARSSSARSGEMQEYFCSVFCTYASIFNGHLLIHCPIVYVDMENKKHDAVLLLLFILICTFMFFSKLL